MAHKTKRLVVSNPTRLLIQATSGHVGATAGTGNFTANNYGTANVVASQTAVTYVIPISGLNVGDIITEWRVLGGTAGASTKTIAAKLQKQVKASGAITTPTDVSSATSDSTATAHAVDIDTVLTTPEEVVDATTYHVLLTITTDAGVTVDITGIEVHVKKALGMDSSPVN